MENFFARLSIRTGLIRQTDKSKQNIPLLAH